MQHQGGESLYASPQDPSLSLTEYCGADFDRTQFFGSFWTPEANLDDGFEELRKYLRQGNDFCKDIADIFQQRFVSVLITFYAYQGCVGRHVREEAHEHLRQVTQGGGQHVWVGVCERTDNINRSLKVAWDAMLLEFKERSEWHNSFCDVIKRTLIDPLLSFKEQQKKDHKATQAPVDKAHKVFSEFAANVAKVFLVVRFLIVRISAQHTQRAKMPSLPMLWWTKR